MPWPLPPLGYVALYAGLVSLGCWVVPLLASNGSATGWQTWAVVVGGAVVVWYAWETKEMRVALTRQIEVGLRPFVVLEPRVDGGFLISNLGDSPALNVRVDTVPVSARWAVEIRFPKTIPVLRPHEEREFPAEDTSGQDFFLAHLNPEFATQELPLTLRYQNVELRPYVVKQRIAPKQHEIIGFGLPEGPPRRWRRRAAARTRVSDPR